MSPPLGALTRHLVRLRIWLGERIFGSETRATLVWAALIGLIGAWASIGFKEATEWLQARFTGTIIWDLSRVLRPCRGGGESSCPLRAACWRG